MRRFRAIALAAGFAILAAPAHSDTTLPAVLSVLGNVTNAARPVGSALVIALNLSSFEAVQTYSSTDGSFNLPALRSGIYRIIAVKHGFIPAVATIVPTRNSQRITLRLEPEKPGRAKSTNQEIWEIRGSLPPDILHELDGVLDPPQQAAADINVPRIRGQMMSMTGMAQSTSPAFAQTVLGVQSRIGESWQLGIRGNLHRVDDPSDDSRFGGGLAQSSVMSMELRSSPTDAYRVASTQSWWRYRDAEDGGGGDQQADVRSHNFEWEHGSSHVAVRYLAQQNVAQQNVSRAPLDSDLIEIAGETPILSTRRNDIGIAVRVTQESLHNVTSETMRTADLSANASLVVVPAFVLHYGMSSRLGIDGTEWAPRTGAELKLSKHTSFVTTGMYKVFDQTHATVMPAVVVWSDDARVLPHYSYSFGFVSKDDDTTNSFSAMATVTAVDAPLRVVFNDGFERFWDGLYVDSGDVRRDIRLAYRRDIGNKLAIDVSTTAGTATQRMDNVLGDRSRSKIFVTADLQSIFFPTGTSLAVSYRELQQPQDAAAATYRSERVNVRVAQSLHLPIDVKLLLGLEVAHAENSPFLLDTLEPDGMSRKYIGGLALNF
jgi:hypothetical protein